MNYYEELGVSRTASIADIRLAYKTLVRVLHPDQHQDDDLRRLSELQLRRLNHILQVLTEPEQRRHYDLTLDRFVPAVLPPDPVASRKSVPFHPGMVRRRLPFDTGVLVWVLIGAIAAGSLVVWLRSPEPGYTGAKAVAAAKPQRAERAITTSGARPPAPVKEDAPRHTGNRVEPAPERAPVRVASDEPAPVTPPKPVAHAETPPTAAAEVASSAPAPPSPETRPAQELPPKPAPSSIAGKWLYVPKPNDGKNTLYPAEYIELRINSSAGVLRGRYRGKYRVPDRAISSEVNFQFEGKQGDSVSLLPWFSTDGSKGELRLKRLTDETIEVNWITTTFGSTNTLASGTAVLYRSDSP